MYRPIVAYEVLGHPQLALYQSASASLVPDLNEWFLACYTWIAHAWEVIIAWLSQPGTYSGERVDAQ